MLDDRFDTSITDLRYYARPVFPWNPFTRQKWTMASPKAVRNRIYNDAREMELIQLPWVMHMEFDTFAVALELAG